MHLVGFYYKNIRMSVKPNFLSICTHNYEGIWRGVYVSQQKPLPASPNDSACDATLQKMEKMKMSNLKCNLVQFGYNLNQFAELQREIREREGDYSNG